MQTSTFRLAAEDDLELFVYRWEPDTPAKAVLQIVHGMAEHAGRYARVAEQLTLAGYAVYAGDCRGHGQTAGTPGDLGYLADSNGFGHALDDLHRVHARIVEQHPGLPIYLFGHSMGSFLVRHYLFTYGESVAGAVLSGTSGGTGFQARLAGIVAVPERLRLGPRGRSVLLDWLLFGGFNRNFKPTRTEFDWLSRDTSEVDKYVADPLCGFAFTVQGWIDVLGGLIEMERAQNIRRVPRSLPLYLFSGDRDPVGQETRGVRSVTKAYRKAGLSDVTERFYPGGRHEMLNETNRAEVQRDLIGWLDAALARRSR